MSANDDFLLATSEEVLIKLNRLEFETAYKHIQESKIYKTEKDLLRSIIILIENEKDNKILMSEIDTMSIANDLQKSLAFFVNGYINLKKQANRDKALFYFKKGLDYSRLLKNNEFEKFSLLNILKVFKKGITQNNNTFYQYLNSYKSIIRNNIDEFWYLYYTITLNDQLHNYHEHYFENENFYREKISLLKNLAPDIQNNNRIFHLTNKLFADYYIKHDTRKAINYYNKSISLIDTSNYFKGSYFRLNLDLARAKSREGKYVESIQLLHGIKNRKDIGDSIINNLNYNFFLSQFHAKIKQFDSAYYYLEITTKLEENYNFNLHNSKVEALELELETEKKEKENINLKNNNIVIEAKRKQNQNIAIGLGGSLALGSIIALLLFKNTKRKQKLAEQQKEIESQKLATVLKEQELTAIDAMIEGQEKERQRIANDLHDDLGGLMANVKLHFNALKDKDSPELFDKTNKLIEEAYQKVRSVAHAKNSGVIANQGLLKAIQNMAEKISASNKIQIEVLDHGLDNRLENSLELTLFRIIQELITNVIKHAEATQATIHLTNHGDSINIMVEDNGIGFNPNQITKTNKGMGISSIDKRIEHLDGKLAIESDKDKGTSVIIDIPL